MVKNLTAGKRRRSSECFRLGGKLFYCLMLILPLAQFCVFYIGVNVNNIALAFKKYDVINNAVYPNGFNNFKMIFDVYKSQDILRKSLRYSFIFFGLNLFVTVPLTLLFAYYIFKKFRFAGFFKIMLFLPSVISAMVFVLFYKFWAENGVAEMLANEFKFFELSEGLLRNSKTMKGSLIFFNLLMSFSSMILIYINAMTQIPTSCLEAADIDGAGEIRKFFSIVIPSIWPTLVSFILIALAGFATNQANILSLYGDWGLSSGPSTLGYYLYELVYCTQFGASYYPYAAALGIFLTVIIAPITLIARWALNKFGPRDF